MKDRQVRLRLLALRERPSTYNRRVLRATHPALEHGLVPIRADP